VSRGRAQPAEALSVAEGAHGARLKILPGVEALDGGGCFYSGVRRLRPPNSLTRGRLSWYCLSSPIGKKR
jgi:hypothetical protein